MYLWFCLEMVVTILDHHFFIGSVFVLICYPSCTTDIGNMFLNNTKIILTISF